MKIIILLIENEKLRYELQKRLQDNISMKLQFDNEMQKSKEEQFSKLQFLEEAIHQSLLKKVILI